MERHQGASALLFGSAAAALLPVEQPGFIDVAATPDKPSDHPGRISEQAASPSPSPSKHNAAVALPDLVPAPARIASRARSSVPEQPTLAPSPSPSNVATAADNGLVRPLSLAPSAPTDAPNAAPAAQALNRASHGNDGGAALPSASAPAVAPVNGAWSPGGTQSPAHTNAGMVLHELGVFRSSRGPRCCAPISRSSTTISATRCGASARRARPNRRIGRHSA